MNNKFRVVLFVLILFSIAVISCKTAEFGNDTIDLNGMIYDFANRPVPNCEITMGRRYSGITDINGRFNLPKVPAGTYVITGYKKGYETYSEEITVKDRGQIIYIRIPSQIQLLNLADEALASSEFEEASEMAERAWQIDKKNAGALFYCAAAKFRLLEYDDAIAVLEKGLELGIDDPYINKFLNELRDRVN